MYIFGEKKTQVHLQPIILLDRARKKKHFMFYTPKMI